MSLRVLVTRPAEQADDLVQALGAVGLEPLLVPAIETAFEPAGGPLDEAARTIEAGTWIAVTSANGARAALAALDRAGVETHRARWAAIGDATARVLAERGLEVAFVPSSPHAATLGAELPIARGERVLAVLGDLAGPLLVDRLRGRGAVASSVVGYRTCEGPETSRSLLRAAFGLEAPAAAVLTSGSTARGLIRLGTVEGLDVTSVPAICAGPETASEASRLGFSVLATASAPTSRQVAATTAAALTPELEPA